MRDLSYDGVMSRKSEIMKKSVGIDYAKYELQGVAFDYEEMMRDSGYSLDNVKKIQKETGVGDTPLVELKNINRLVKRISPKGMGARLFLKDEAMNPSGSFKDRRASVNVYRAKQIGYDGIITATSGNYGAAVASEAAKRGLKAIVVQECYDSSGVGQPEILEKARSCEAYGAEVVQLSVGPELFYYSLILLEETGYFNASLYTPFAVAGIETLGWEIAEQSFDQLGRYPDIVAVTHSGGGNLTGTARGLRKAGAKDTKIVGVSVDLRGLHMASDRDFNRKSFTTGHSGFGVPFATYPDRADVPRNAARCLRYMDRYVLVTQGEVFWATEMLAALEGLQRGPAGNTSLAGAFALATEMGENQIIVINETEYTGAGKSPSAQLTFARKNGIKIGVGDPIQEDKPGETIVIPAHPSMVKAIDFPMEDVRKSYLKHLISKENRKDFSDLELKFIADDTSMAVDDVTEAIEELRGDK